MIAAALYMSAFLSTKPMTAVIPLSSAQTIERPNIILYEPGLKEQVFGRVPGNGELWEEDEVAPAPLASPVQSRTAFAFPAIEPTVGFICAIAIRRLRIGLEIIRRERRVKFYRGRTFLSPPFTRRGFTHIIVKISRAANVKPYSIFEKPNQKERVKIPRRHTAVHGGEEALW